ncbi:hypothetical protein SMICM17S_10396 [Streptomyces microflavus]
MFGFSRTKAAELAAAGKVQVDGSVAGKSERVHGGAWLEVEMPQAAAPVQVVAEPVEGMEIVHDDDDIVVIMKPVGVAAHPSPGWEVAAPPSSAASPPPGTASRRPAPPSARASCTASTSAPPA